MATEPDREGIYEERTRASQREDLVDLYDLTEWEPRTPFDVFCVLLEEASRSLIAAGALVSAALVLLTTVLSLLASPVVGALTAASLLPASAALYYIWTTDPYERPPVSLLVVTFLLGCLLTLIPLGVNTALLPLFGSVPAGLAVFFFLVVAPVEETVKWLAVRLYGYDQEVFNSAADGAALGAIAGLAFATMENAVYISGLASLAGAGGGTQAILRGAVAPLHVVWSAIAGYYLALAKLNREHTGALLLKGLLIAAVLHGLHNTAFYLTDIAEAATIPGLGVAGTERLFITVFLLGFYSAVAYYPVRKLNRYRRYRIRQRDIEDVRDSMTMSDEEVGELLRNNGVGVLSLSKEDRDTYSIPMSYGYDHESGLLCLMLSYAPRSEKRRWVRNTRNASFVVYSIEDTSEADSVVVEGELVELSEEKELQEGYDALSNNALFTVMHESGALAEDSDFKMYRMETDSITGRKFRHDIDEMVKGKTADGPPGGAPDVEV